VIEARIRRYREVVRDGSSVTPAVRDAVRYAAERVPVAIAAIVAAEDVARGKPDPEGHLRALERLGSPAPGDVCVVEDTEAGIAAAKAAGMRCLAVLGTLARERLAAADEVVERIDVALVRRLLA
jgi:beta-phosphoglucomutase